MQGDGFSEIYLGKRSLTKKWPIRAALIFQTQPVLIRRKNMTNVVELLKKITPELVDKICLRYLILREINYSQPIGRRRLSDKLEVNERPLRREIKLLEEQDLIEIGKWGMQLTPEGKTVIQELEKFVINIKGLQRASDNIKKAFGFKDVIIVPGDSDKDPLVKKQMGKTAAHYFLSRVKNGDVVAIMGGTTMAEIAESMEPVSCPVDVLVVPGRGALGERVDIQADTIAARLAQKLGGRYKLLHIPDTLDKQTMERVVKDNKIKNVIQMIKSANILLHGIGTAEEMAKRRGLSAEEIAQLKKSKAVSETLGYYFDEKGNIVYETSSIGLDLKDIKKIRTVITVAGGTSKALAIISVTRYFNDVLITDEGAAQKIITHLRRGMNEQKKY